MCGKLENRQLINMDIISEGPILNDQHKNTLNLHFSLDEIRAAMWSIPKDKAPGLDEYNSGFFKAMWDVVGVDIVQENPELLQYRGLSQGLEYDCNHSHSKECLP